MLFLLALVPYANVKVKPAAWVSAGKLSKIRTKEALM